MTLDMALSQGISNIVNASISYDKKTVEDLLARRDIVVSDFSFDGGKTRWGIQNHREMLDYLVSHTKFDKMKLRFYGWLGNTPLCHLELKKHSKIRRVLNALVG